LSPLLKTKLAISSINDISFYAQNMVQLYWLRQKPSFLEQRSRSKKAAEYPIYWITNSLSPSTLPHFVRSVVEMRHEETPSKNSTWLLSGSLFINPNPGGDHMR
jgi:hypothetical protein